MHASGAASDIAAARFSDEVLELEEPAAATPVATAPAAAAALSHPVAKKSLLANIGLGGYARRTLGICLLIVVVFLWTLSNFLASVRGPFCPPSSFDTRPTNLTLAVHIFRPYLR